MNEFEKIPEQIDAIKKLIARYRKTDIKLMIDLRMSYGLFRRKNNPLAACDIVNIITGFGHSETCTVCKPIDSCTACFHMYMSPFTGYEICSDQPTYKAILNSKSDEEAVEAMHARADYLELLISEHEKEA